MPLTDIAIRAAKPRERPYKLYDEHGLYMIVTPSGGRWWRFKFRYGGKEKSLALGTYPLVGLKAARGHRDDERRLLAMGVDPSAARKARKAGVPRTITVHTGKSEPEPPRTITVPIVKHEPLYPPIPAVYLAKQEEHLRGRKRKVKRRGKRYPA